MARSFRRKLFFALLPSLVLVLFIYLFFHFRYYAKQEHFFDPFLQMPHSKIDFEAYQKQDIIVLTLGGSTTFNSRIADEKRYPNRLEHYLKLAYPTLDIKVINGGMDWYTSKHSLISYMTYYRKVKPDIVVLMHAINDICRSFSPPDYAGSSYRDDYSHFYGPSIKAALPHSFEKELYEQWFGNNKPTISHDYRLAAFQSIDAYEYYLHTLVQSIVKDSATCLLVEQAALYKKEMTAEEKNALWFGREYMTDGNLYASSKSIGVAMKAYNQTAKTVAKNTKTFFVSTSPYIPRDLDHFTDDVHYTEKGADALAKRISDYMIQEGYLNLFASQ